MGERKTGWEWGKPWALDGMDRMDLVDGHGLGDWDPEIKIMITRKNG
jgi:hypothetical protein